MQKLVQYHPLQLIDQTHKTWSLNNSRPWTSKAVSINLPILGIDFLQHYDLVVDMKQQRLLDSVTRSQVQGIVSHRPSINLTLLPSYPFEAISRTFHQ